MEGNRWVLNNHMITMPINLYPYSRLVVPITLSGYPGGSWVLGSNTYGFLSFAKPKGKEKLQPVMIHCALCIYYLLCKHCWFPSPQHYSRLGSSISRWPQVTEVSSLCFNLFFFFLCSVLSVTVFFISTFLDLGSFFEPFACSTLQVLICIRSFLF